MKLSNIIFKMECCSCLLRYNLQNRSPLIISCGHSLCSKCLSFHQVCPICGQDIQSDPKPNYSLIQMMHKDSKPIDKFIKVCFVGSSGVGKTSLIRQFMGQEFSDDVATTIGYDFTFRDRVLGNYLVRFQLWDSAGQERYRAISPIHYKNAHVVVIVYNVAASSNDNQLAQWIQQTEKHAPAQALKIIVGNKLDLVAQGKVCKPIDDQAWKLIKEKGIQCYETSCKNGAGVQQFWQVLQNFFINRKQYQIPQSKLNINQHHIKIKQKFQQVIKQAKLIDKKSVKKVKSKKQQCC